MKTSTSKTKKKPAVARVAAAKTAMAKKAVASKAVAKPAVARKSVRKPAVAKAAVLKPVAAKAVVNEPSVVETAVVEQLAVEQSVVGQSVAEPAVARLQLPARLQINNLDALYASCCKLLGAKKKHVVVDGGDITLCDSAGVQMLVAFFRSFTAAGGRVEWENYSVQLYQMADELGVSGQLGG